MSAHPRVVVRFLGVGLAVAALSIRSRAARSEDAVPTDSTRIELSAFRAPPAPPAAKALWVPSDPGFADSWLEGGADDGRVLEFEAPPVDVRALRGEDLAELVRRAVPQSADAGWASRASGDLLEAWSTPQGLERTRAAVRFFEAALAPRLSLRATLSGAPGSAPLAVGGVRVLPRRWTTVWLRTNVRRFLAGYEIEIAQESVANEPKIAVLPEGEELHVRWSPGERTSLLEVFSGDVRHGKPFTVDLAVVRNVPEGNTQGTVSLPQTAVSRAMTAIAFPTAGGTAQWTWDGPDGPRTLSLTVDAVPAAPADIALTETGAAATALGVVRGAAAYAALGAELREAALDDAVQRYQATGPTGKPAGSPDPVAQGFLVLEGAREEVARLRAQAAADEGRLLPAVVEVRSVVTSAIPADLVVGAVLEPAAASALLALPVHASVRVPVTTGLGAVVWSGTSKTGLANPSSEIAQQASAVSIAPVASFDGFTGRVRARASDAGFTLSVSGTVSWARPDASTIELAFRRPVGMTTSEGAGPDRVDNPAARRALLPVEGHGSAQVEAAIPFTSADAAAGRWAVLAVARRPTADGHDVLVLLGSLKK